MSLLQNYAKYEITSLLFCIDFGVRIEDPLFLFLCFLLKSGWSEKQKVADEQTLTQLTTPSLHCTLFSLHTAVLLPYVAWHTACNKS